ncbi:MAG: T9SS type A sorting domain-containing protein, partial [Chitinivibrionales bacterium]
TNLTAWDNGDYNFHVRDGANHVFKNCVSFGGGHTDRIVGDVSAPNALTEDDFDWNFTASPSDFVTMTPGPDSDPLSNGFLMPVDGGQFVDAGVQSEGIAFNGSAPDLGAVESGGPTTAVSRPQAAMAQTFTAGVVNGRSNISISYSLPTASRVSIQLISSNGRLVSKAGTFKAQGEHTVTIDKKGLSKGMYFVAIDAGHNRSIMKKVMVF